MSVMLFIFANQRRRPGLESERERACAHIGGAGLCHLCQKPRGFLLGFLPPLPHLRTFRSGNPLNQG